MKEIFFLKIACNKLQQLALSCFNLPPGSVDNLETQERWAVRGMVTQSVDTRSMQTENLIFPMENI